MSKKDPYQVNLISLENALRQFHSALSGFDKAILTGDKTAAKKLAAIVKRKVDELQATVGTETAGLLEE